MLILINQTLQNNFFNFNILLRNKIKNAFPGIVSYLVLILFLCNYPGYVFALLFPETHKITFYRCLQEALTNVARHAHAKHVWVELRTDGDEICLTIEDDGQDAELPRP